ncbi:MAG: deoxynucleoside kinase [Deltaproteobacteria bacterium]|nr:deoxynucleoside kinase [Deltaproteobacteria bacterium]
MAQQFRLDLGAAVRRFIVVEGLIGVGKSSLCRLLRDRWGARLVLEPAEDNPFLALFYEDKGRYAFPVQMFYLVNRWRQQEGVRQGELFSELVVSDYVFEKDRLFAEMTLDEMELDLYDRFAGALGESAPVPDLFIWLDAPTEVLMERIHRRQAPNEHLIEASYLEELRGRYKKLLAGWTACPILEIDNTDVNYVDDPEAMEQVLARIEAVLAGTERGASGFEDVPLGQTNLFTTS